jgi:two-component system chemotaxis response regulator CheY
MSDPKPAQGSAPHANAPSRRALVVDDSQAMRTILSGILGSLGFEVVQAKSGAEALEQVRTAGLTLALVDWNMPGMDGLEFVQKVRADKAHDGVRILMVSTESKPAKVARALEAGASEYVMKPFTRAVLLEKLKMMGIA